MLRTFPPYIIQSVPLSGSYFFAVGQNATSTSNTLSNGTLRVAPWWLPKGISITRIGAEVTSVGEAGSKVRLGIYADNGNCFPGALWVDAGQIAGDSATVQELTISSLSLPAGLYWIGAAVQSVTTTQPTLRTIGNAWSPPVFVPYTSMPGSNGSTLGFATAASTITGALPTAFPAANAAASIPRTFVKVA